LLVGVLVVSALLGAIASAADRVPDVGCEVCGEASDPVQFSFMARLEGSKSGVGAVNVVPRTVGDAYDPVQYTFAARRSATVARDVEIARLRGLSGPGAGSWSGIDELVHLRGLVEAAGPNIAGEDCPALNSPTRAEQASTARLNGVAAWHLGEDVVIREVTQLASDRLAGAGRLTALAAHLNQEADEASPGLLCVLGP
jgi:hypothetical protein